MIAAHYQATAAADLVAGLEIFPTGCARASTRRTAWSTARSVLADLLEGGVEREKAYRAVQAAANRTIESGEDFGTLLADEDIDAGPAAARTFP